MGKKKAKQTKSKHHMGVDNRIKIQTQLYRDNDITKDAEALGVSTPWDSQDRREVGPRKEERAPAQEVRCHAPKTRIVTKKFKCHVNFTIEQVS